MSFVLSLIFFGLGLLIGSFINCLVYRLEQNETIQGRSYCPHCKHALSWRHLIPVISFLVLGGRCAFCKKTISWHYPVMELAVGIIFVALLNLQLMPFMTTASFLLGVFGLLYIVSSLIVIFIYDLKHFIIPDVVLFPAICVGIFLRIFGGMFHNYMGAAALASGFFLIIYFISRGAWIGFGDVKLAILLGLLVGFPNILAALFLAFFFGAIIGLALMLGAKKGLKSEVPFAPFLIGGTVFALFWGKHIITWYLTSFIL